MDRTASRMKQDWDERAREDARYFIAKTAGDDAFEASAADDLSMLTEGIGARLTPTSRVLDVGCGIGRLIKPLAPRVAEVHGVDVSGEMIARARDYLKDLPNVRLFENSGSDLDALDDEAYDFGYSYLMFQHIPDRDIVRGYLQEAFRVVKRGGIFRFQMDGRGDRWIWRLYRRLRGNSSWRGVLWTREQMIEAARAAGFEVLDVRVDPRSHGAMRYAYVWVTCSKPG